MKKLFIIFAVLCLAAPAMAADWNFFGSARFATFWIDSDPDVAGVDSDEQLQWTQQGNSRIGANVKFNDQIGGGFEMSDSFGKRKLFGTYTMGNGSQLLIGQTYTPTALFYSNSVFDGDGDLLGVGEFYEGRLPMIQWKMGGLKVALITPNLTDYQLTPISSTFDPVTNEITVTPGVNFDTDSELPKIEVAYGWKGDMFFFDVFGGYQTYDLDGPTSDVSIDAYVLGGGVGMNFGAFFAKVGAHFGQNLGNYGAYNPRGLGNTAALNAAKDDALDNDGMGYLAVLGFNASDMLTFEAGLGYEEAEADGAVEEDSTMQYYVNATINIAPGFFIVPEVGMIQDDPAGPGAEPEVFYAGAKWQINF